MAAISGMHPAPPCRPLRVTFCYCSSMPAISGMRPAPPPPSLAPAPQTLAAFGSQTDPAALRVLAAEDHPANRLVLQALLEPVGVAVSFVENGREAVDALSLGGFDLVLMDVNMPQMDGVSALTAIRALSGSAARTPVHMVTANVFEDDVQRYLAAGADGVLKKPIDVRELFALVDRAGAAKAAAAPQDLARAAG